MASQLYFSCGVRGDACRSFRLSPYTLSFECVCLSGDNQENTRASADLFMKLTNENFHMNTSTFRYIIPTPIMEKTFPDDFLSKRELIILLLSPSLQCPQITQLAITDRTQWPGIQNTIPVDTVARYFLLLLRRLNSWHCRPCCTCP